MNHASRSRPPPSRSARRTVAGVAALVAAALAGCRSQPFDQADKAQKAVSAPSQPEAAAEATAADAAVDSGSAAEASDAATPDAPLEGALFTREIRAAFRMAACGGDDAWIPANVSRDVVDRHCAMLTSAYDEYRREWLAVAAPFLAKIRPAGLPKDVVYPFGGGDLVTALATFPDAETFTTISLEIAGDVRAVDRADDKRLARELDTLREHLGKLFLKAHSRTVNLDIETHGAVPGEMAFTMAALVIHGFQPVTMRYFRFEPDGSLHYLTDDDITRALKQNKTGRKGPFANAEIRFCRPGERERVLRHVAYDLSDASLAKRSALLAHLDTHGKVSAMTKAASYLLWDDGNFRTIRTWLMTHTDWMISDTTGVPPRVAQKFGFVQDVYGNFEGAEPFGPVNGRDLTAFRRMFKGHDPLPFRYGYPDNKSHGHIVVTHKPDVVAKP